MLQTGPLHCRLPRKNMQREPQLSADIGYTGSWFSIHVHLPHERSERIEIARSRLRLDPG